MWASALLPYSPKRAGKPSITHFEAVEQFPYLDHRRRRSQNKADCFLTLLRWVNWA
jgi:hypothetical protein